MVELRPAYVWDCPECGKEVFERGLVPEMAEDDRQAVREEMGVQPWEEGCIMAMPETVRCPHCGAEFPTLHFEDA